MLRTLPVHDGRIMPNLDDETPCKFGCKYCFADRDFYSDPVRPVSLPRSQVKSLVEATLEAEDVSAIGTGCSREVFQNQEEGLDHVRFLAGFGRNITIPTKASLSDQTIAALSEIDQQLRMKGNRIVIRMSFISGRERRDLETKTPDFDSRINTLSKLSQSGLSTGVIIRPILPPSFVATSEIQQLVDATKDFVTAYTVGAEFLFTDKIAEKMGLDIHSLEMEGHTTSNVSLGFSPSQECWHRYVDPRESELMSFIKSQGRAAFKSSGETIDYLSKV